MNGMNWRSLSTALSPPFIVCTSPKYIIKYPMYTYINLQWISIVFSLICKWKKSERETERIELIEQNIVYVGRLFNLFQWWWPMSSPRADMIGVPFYKYSWITFPSPEVQWAMWNIHEINFKTQSIDIEYNCCGSFSWSPILCPFSPLAPIFAVIDMHVLTCTSVGTSQAKVIFVHIYIYIYPYIIQIDRTVSLSLSHINWVTIDSTQLNPTRFDWCGSRVRCQRDHMVCLWKDLLPFNNSRPPTSHSYNRYTLMVHCYKILLSSWPLTFSLMFS